MDIPVDRNPTPDSSDQLLGVKWLPATNLSTQHLFIDRNLSMTETDFLAERMTFWDTISSVVDTTSGEFSSKNTISLFTVLLLLLVLN